jgi:hypothetical protein
VAKHIVVIARDTGEIVIGRSRDRSDRDGVEMGHRRRGVNVARIRICLAKEGVGRRSQRPLELEKI